MWHLVNIYVKPLTYKTQMYIQCYLILVIMHSVQLLMPSFISKLA